MKQGFCDHTTFGGDEYKRVRDRKTEREREKHDVAACTKKVIKSEKE